jgi:hypothetical protein
VKPEFWTSESNGRLTRDGRLVFLGLISLADDHGRFRGSLRSLASGVLPFDADATRTLLRVLPDLVCEGKIVLFRNRGDTFGVVTGWPNHQRISHPAASKFPSPQDPESSILVSPEELRSDSGGARKNSGRIEEGIKDQGRDRGSGIEDRGSRRGHRSKKNGKRQPDLPAIPPAPPPAPRAKSPQVFAYEEYQLTRRIVLDELQIPFVPDQEPNWAYVTMAISPILKSVEAESFSRPALLNPGDPPLSGWDRLLTLWFDQPWAAKMIPPFPFSAFASEQVQLIGKPEKNQPGLLARLSG